MCKISLNQITASINIKRLNQSNGLTEIMYFKQKEV